MDFIMMRDWLTPHTTLIILHLTENHVQDMLCFVVWGFGGDDGDFMWNVKAVLNKDFENINCEWEPSKTVTLDFLCQRYTDIYVGTWRHYCRNDCTWIKGSLQKISLCQCFFMYMPEFLYVVCWFYSSIWQRWDFYLHPKTGDEMVVVLTARKQWRNVSSQRESPCYSG